MGDESPASGSDQSEVVREAFRELGFADRGLKTAVAAYKTPEQARRWIETLGRSAYDPSIAYDIAMSGLTVDEYLRWRDAGLDRSALMLPRSLRRAGLGVHEFAQWSSAGFDGDSAKDLPYLVAALPFSEVLTVLGDWCGSASATTASSAELIDILKSGMSVAELRSLINRGMTGHQIYAWRRTGIPAADWPSWMELGVDADTAAGYISRNVTVAVASEWEGTGIPQPTLFRLIDKHIPVAVAREWSAVGLPSSDIVALADTRLNAASALEWLDAGITAADVKRFVERDVPIGLARAWRESGFTTDDTLTFLDLGVPPSTAQKWLAAGVPPAESQAFMRGDVALQDALAWRGAGFAAEDAVALSDGDVPLDTAKHWRDATDYDADDIVDFMKMRVTLEQAVSFERRGIGAHQVTRTEDGLEMDIEPWQEDPADQLPAVVSPGGFGVTLWTTALSGDPVAHDVSFVWDGRHTADWYEDISDSMPGLSVMSSSPVHGVMAWPNGRDVLLTFQWSDLGLEGHDTLRDVAPISDGDPTNPVAWVRLAEALLNFVLLDLGSGARETVQYYEADGEWDVEIHDLFKEFLASKLGNQASFQAWLDGAVASGKYTTR